MRVKQNCLPRCVGEHPQNSPCPIGQLAHFRERLNGGTRFPNGTSRSSPSGRPGVVKGALPEPNTLADVGERL